MVLIKVQKCESSSSSQKEKEAVNLRGKEAKGREGTTGGDVIGSYLFETSGSWHICPSHPSRFPVQVIRTQTQTQHHLPKGLSLSHPSLSPSLVLFRLISILSDSALSYRSPYIIITPRENLPERQIHHYNSI
jgi:hypothetical protein